MKKYIECEKLSKALKIWQNKIAETYGKNDEYVKCLDAVLLGIDRTPAADVREVVLCRDCKHKGWVQEPEHGKSVDYCRLIERCVDKQFFCAAGEKREGS